MTPTQEDKAAAAEFRWLWNRDLATDADLDQAFIHYRLAAEERGARMEREQAVAWLRDRQKDHPLDLLNYGRIYADGINSGKHTAIRQIDPASLGAE